MKMREFRQLLSEGKQVAFVISQGALVYDEKKIYKNCYLLRREDAISQIVSAVDDKEIIVSTTGKISRELFEIRKNNGAVHDRDFLTVGSMGHCSSIALGIALQHPDKKVWCLDGDGAALMHLGAMALIGQLKPQNFVHIIFNNGAHESVGGLPTAAPSLEFSAVANQLGYVMTALVRTKEELGERLSIAKQSKELFLLEIQCSMESRKDLIRPTIKPDIMMKAFMSQLC